MAATPPTLPDIAKAVDAIRACVLTLAGRLPAGGPDAPADPAALSPEELLADGTLTVETAAEMFSVSEREVEYLVANGDVPSFKRGKSRLIPKKAMVLFFAKVYREWQEQCRKPSAAR